jgi:tRNA (cmo5U34)-methyltransferase
LGSEEKREMDKSRDTRDQDHLYREPLDPVPPFSFTEEVASVFDDMANRSIPFYDEVQRLTVTLAHRYTRPRTNIYDLGCSTGTTIKQLREEITRHGPAGISIRGVDSSRAMCLEAEAKLGLGDLEEGGSTADGDVDREGGANEAATPSPRERVSSEQRTDGGDKEATANKPDEPETIITHGDAIAEPIENASVVILNYTLHFVKPQQRHPLVQRILRGLLPGGVLLVSDKMLQSSTSVSRVFMDIYYDLKRSQGYSRLEIAQKREALENILVPYRVEEERELFLRAGFASVDIFFNWCNFSSFICVKDELSRDLR